MVTKKPKGLGRGLEALLGPKVAEAASPDAQDNARNQTPSSLPLTELVPGVYQPRTRMDEGALYELAESIKAQGIMQPILVRKLADGPNAGKYEIIAGERRFRASRLAGLDSVPVLVRDVPNESAAAMALIENIQREDLNPIEEAVALQRLQQEFQLTQQQVADAVGKSRVTVANLLRLIALPEVIKTMLSHGDLEMGHARALLGLPENQQVEGARHVVARGLTVRQTEALVRQWLSGKPEPVEAAKPDPDIARLGHDACRISRARCAVAPSCSMAMSARVIPAGLPCWMMLRP